MKVLVVGGTGPTGPAIVAELRSRGWDVTVLHRGLHEPDDAALAAVEHMHADPHFAESLESALVGRSFDTCVATYGRLRVVASVMEGRCGHFVGIGGNPAHPGSLDRWATFPTGMRIGAKETDPTVRQVPVAASGPDGPGHAAPPDPGHTTGHTPRPSEVRAAFAAKVARAERAVLDGHERGAYLGTYLRYPIVYGWRTWLQYERGIVRRVLDGRRRIVLPDGGLSVFTRCADVNAARAVALVVDQPDVAGGRVFHCGDDDQYSLAQWTELCLAVLSADVELVGVPLTLARSAWDLLPSGPPGTPHSIVDLTALRRDLGYADVIDARHALTALVTRLAVDPSMAQVTYDRASEDAELAAYDEMAARLGPPVFDDDAYFARWHPYDHPDTPGDTNRYGGLQPPATLGTEGGTVP